MRENSSSTSPGKLEQLLIMLTDTNKFSKQRTHCKLFINRSLSFDDLGFLHFPDGGLYMIRYVYTKLKMLQREMGLEN